LLSLAAHGTAPYKEVLTHGFMVDADKEKISKSKQGQGGYEKPQTAEAYIGTYGADIVRLWVASQDFRNDIVVSEERIKTVAETYRLLRNSLRFQLSNLYDYDPEKHAVPHDQLTPLDRWMLDAWSAVEAQVFECYEKYEFHIVYQKISQFTAVQISSIYHDLVKDRLYSDAAHSHARRSTQTVLHHIVRRLSQALSPILVFTSDEAWGYIPGNQETDTVHLQEWQPQVFNLSDAEREQWGRWLEWRDQALSKLEDARREKLIGKALEARLVIQLPEAELEAANAHQAVLREIMNVSQLVFESGSDVVVRVEKADGSKCKRCWHWETEVGSHTEHPEICPRCIEAVSASTTQTA
jgi:isoleucyl-tRNA synthetase